MKFALTRREAGGLAFAAALTPFARATRAAEGETETHGLSSFGDLAEPPDFKRFAYVNPDAPKGGTLVVQLRTEAGNQNFDTFDTLNIHIFKGDGAAGMDATFDTLMSGRRRRAGLALWPPGAQRRASRPTSSPTASCCGPRRASTTARRSRRATSPSR